MGRMNGKVAIVTGAGQGVGRGIAHAFAKQGASLVLVDIVPERVHAVQKELQDLSLSAIALTCDVADQAAVGETVKTAIERFGRLDVVVNNAAAGYEKFLISDMTNEYLKETIDTNLFGTFWFMSASFPHLKASRGSVINLASEAGTEGWAELGAYAATKEAVRAISRTAAKEWGPFGINVNVICPLANSPGMQWFQETHPEHFEAVLRQVPLGYLGDCEKDIGPVAVFLATDDSKYITGHTFMVDGGRAVLR
ncbi:SDR family NAD(P)-dependent oxidoreductase [Castellaniella sp. GW247-6E4]|uniref:SDR family NAD(P)-dependent oxidoreductase n=1 Tax=Castellaniella sp. GW247-6E4 TaxID=3140380 RepID=UPI0033152D7A